MNYEEFSSIQRNYKNNNGGSKSEIFPELHFIYVTNTTCKVINLHRQNVSLQSILSLTIYYIASYSAANYGSENKRTYSRY